MLDKQSRDKKALTKGSNFGTFFWHIFLVLQGWLGPSGQSLPIGPGYAVETEPDISH